ncbi:hypothetical protein [Kribbella shirazensis]|uniref:Uncharacterized protein n=1 Tax=Kribbella shirazensis TaxID=1105143 RepID=A0A7X5VDV0_9ACTN|nr:hypothetical protein [Kribbella shirazensis]NIK59409.1 hypothetical protein [Kribbella shirazensis]
MSTDIERLLAAAADDTDQPLNTDVDDLLVRARRSVRSTRIATVSTAVLTTGVIIAGAATWSANRDQSTAPAGVPGATITIDAKTGLVVDGETGKTIQPPPPVSPLSDAEIYRRCVQYDRENVDFLREQKANLWDKAGPITPQWKVVYKSGDQSLLSAGFLSPDKSILSTCTMDAPQKPFTNGRLSTTEKAPKSTAGVPQAAEAGAWVPVAGAARVLVEYRGDKSPRQALVGTDGFYTLGYTGVRSGQIPLQRIRAYDATGKKIWELVNKPADEPTVASPTGPDNVTVKTADPVTPDAVLTKDPLTGKALVPPPPVSPLTDEEITTRCRGVDGIYLEGGSPAQDPRIKAAGPVTKDWKVALKTGTGDKVTAVLISPDQKVYAWCHMLAATAKGPYDYTRGAVQANGRFGDTFEFGMVPDGVAQIVVDLPKQGPTRALISNGYYIWGLTGGNSGIQNVRVRGYDAHGKLIYDQKKDVDADFD